MKNCPMILVLLGLSLCVSSCGLLRMPANIIRHTVRGLGIAGNESKDLPVAVMKATKEFEVVKNR